MKSLSTSFAAILADIRARLFRLMASRPERAPILMLVHNYLDRTATRLTRLYTLWRAGTLPAPRIEKPRPGRARTPPPLRLPRQRAWLIRQDQPIAVHNSQLRHLLAQPEFEEFLRAVPRAARLVRPVLHLLAPDPPPPLLALPPRPRKPRPPRPRPPPLPPLFPPIQPWVLAAARASKKRYG
jgi:hypothetical protein